MSRSVFAGALRALVVVALSSIMPLVGGRCLAVEPYNPDAARRAAEHDAELARQKAENDERMSELKGSLDKTVWGAGLDLGVTYPLPTSGWSPQPGVSFGVGGRGGFGRFDIDLVQWGRRESGVSLTRTYVNLGAGFRIPLLDRSRGGSVNIRGPWLKLGAELAFDRQEALVTGNNTASVGYTSIGLATGAGWTLPLGSFYLGADATFHLDKRFSTVADQGAVGKGGALFFNLGVVLGYAGRHPIDG